MILSTFVTLFFGQTGDIETGVRAFFGGCRCFAYGHHLQHPFPFPRLILAQLSSFKIKLIN